RRHRSSHPFPARRSSDLEAIFFPQAEVQDVRRTADLDLARRIQSGDQEAFRELVERYQTKVFSIVHKILRNQQDTEDTAQVVFTDRKSTRLNSSHLGISY